MFANFSILLEKVIYRLWAWIACADSMLVFRKVRTKESIDSTGFDSRRVAFWPCEASQADPWVSGAKTQRFSDVKT
jgi:hypothetical protein